MNSMQTLRSLLVAISLFVGAGVVISAQTPSPAPTMPPGMKGANTSDPRAKLSAGLYDAGVAAVGIKHISLLKKPEAFDLGVDPDGPKVATAMKVFGIANASQIPPAARMSFAGLAFANSDLALQGNHLFMGNFYGI